VRSLLSILFVVCGLGEYNKGLIRELLYLRIRNWKIFKGLGSWMGVIPISEINVQLHEIIMVKVCNI